MSAAILGIGLAVPEHAIDKAASAALLARLARADNARWLESVHRGSTVRSRGSVLLDAHGEQSFFTDDDPHGPTTARRIEMFRRSAGRLGLDASRRALEAAGLPAESISHLVTVSCTGFAAPGLDADLCLALPLSPSVHRTNIGFMGCHGAINALRVADAIARADRGSRILICAVELCTLHLHYGHRRDRQIANSLFADGAAAAVIGVPERDVARPRIASTASVLVPGTRDLMSWHVGDHGFEMSLSPRVPEAIQRELPAWLDGWLTARSLRRADVHSWVVHPGGPKIIDAVEAALDLPAGALDASRQVLAAHGNMSSPTVLFILDRLMRSGARQPTIMLAFGPGLVVEGALLI